MEIYSVTVATYFEKISSSTFEVGLASVNIFQFMSTEDRSLILTCLILFGHGSENWKGVGGTMMLHVAEVT